MAVVGNEARDHFHYLMGAEEFMADVARIMDLGYGIMFSKESDGPSAVGLTPPNENNVVLTIPPDYRPDDAPPWEVVRAIRITVERLSREAKAVQSGVAPEGAGVGMPPGIPGADGECVCGEGASDNEALAGTGDAEGSV